MKNFKYITIIIALAMLIFACEREDSCVFDSPDGRNVCDIPESELSGITAGTYYDGDSLNGVVGTIFYTQDVLGEAPPGQNWNLNGTPPVSYFTPSNWTIPDIGVVFGITTDVDDNIYLANSDIYALQYGFISFPSSNTAFQKPNGSSVIYKCAPPTYNATVYASLPNNMIPGNGIGNIAYDKWNDQIFATNLDDGKIYRIVGGIVQATTYDPFNADTSGPTNLAPQDERIFGIGVNNEGGNVKVYFARITADTRELYSIQLLANGDFPAAGSEQLEISNLPGTQLAITDLAFNSEGTIILITERGNPHDAITFSYQLVGASWTSLVNRYYTGDSPTHDQSSAGGVDFFKLESCNDYFWNSGNALSNNWVYGAEGIPVTGNSAATHDSQDYFIDFDDYNNLKGGIGDVEVIDNYECYCTEE